MAISDVIAHIDAEIAKLQQVKALLSGGPDAPKSGRGRPKGSKNVSALAASASPTTAKKATKGKRQLSPEARAAIADAQKRRWAERRASAAK